MYRLRYPLLSLAGESGQLLGKFDIKVNLKSGKALKNIYSSSHKISKDGKDKNTSAITYSKSNFRPARDFTLFWSDSEKDINIDLLTGKDGSDRFFLLLLSGSRDTDVKNTVAREIVFLLDTSGSMQDNDKISQAKRALLTALSLLNKKDSFNIITFSSQLKLFKNQTVAADKANLTAAKNYVNEVQAVGGTSINEALLESLKSFHNTDKLPIVLFLTDGVPTIGESNIDNILNNVKKANIRNVRFFNLGVGYNVNVKLLDKLANNTAGTREYIAPDEDIEVKTGNICSKITSPVLTDLSLDFGRAKVDDIFPRKLGDLYAGSQIIAAGKFDPALKHLAVSLEGRFGKVDKSYTTEFDLSKAREVENVAAIWAMRKVGFMLEQIRLNGESTELVAEVKRLGTKYGIVTPYTSFLVVEEGEGMARNEVEAARREVKSLSAGLKKEFSSENFVGKSSQVRSRMSGSIAGADVMEEADVSIVGRLLRRKGNVKNKRIRQAEIKYAVGRAFILNNGKWIEATLLNEKGYKTIKVKFLSEEYFDLIKTNTKVAKIASLGDNVIFKLNGKIYHISEQ
ncbi:MAG: VWA domain-containing protein [Planctomycetota bacterium]|jgi:Ca-activated chloride channel family protein